MGKNIGGGAKGLDTKRASANRMNINYKLNICSFEN